MLQIWSTLDKSLWLLLNLSLFLFIIAYKCINFATVKIVVYCIVLYIGLCVSIKNVFSHKKTKQKKTTRALLFLVVNHAQPRGEN